MLLGGDRAGCWPSQYLRVVTGQNGHRLLQAATPLISIIENTGIPLCRLTRAAAISFFRFVVESIIGARSIGPYLMQKDNMVLKSALKSNAVTATISA